MNRMRTSRRFDWSRRPLQNNESPFTNSSFIKRSGEVIKNLILKEQFRYIKI